MNINKSLVKVDINKLTNRKAKLVNEGIVYYLYITAENSDVIENDALSFMIIDPPYEIDWMDLRINKKPPYLSKEYATEYTVIKNPQENDFSFIWSKDGHSVALKYRNEPISFIDSKVKIGFSRATNKSSPIVNPWNSDLFQYLFET
jgi:hypothetical protein